MMKMKMKWIGLVAWGIWTAAMSVMLAKSGAKVEGLEYSLEQSKKAHELLQKNAAAAKKVQQDSLKTLQVQLDEIQGRQATELQAVEELKKAHSQLEAYRTAYEGLSVKADVLANAAVDNSPARTPNSVYQRPVDSGPAPTLEAGKAKVAPLWQLPTRAKATEVATRKAQKEWGSNFAMMNHEIERQMEGYDKLVQYHKQVWKPVMRTLFNDAGEKWPDSYAMMVYELERQMEAKDKLDGKR